MEPPRRGRALLIVMSEFYTRPAARGDPLPSSPGARGDPLPPRRGAKKDADQLFKVLSRLNYQVRLHYDLAAEEIYALYEQESSEKQGEFFLSVLSSHGEEGAIYDLYGTPVKLDNIFKLLSPERCPALAAVPKIFFVQACRGDLLDAGVELETDSIKPPEDSFSLYLSIPSDTTVMFASSAGYAAFLNPSGSVFLQTLCDLLRGEERHLELLQLMTRLSHTVAHHFQARGMYQGHKAMPCLVSNMTQEAYPFCTLTKEEREQRRVSAGEP
ncbi:caspase-7-like [Lissotriton helveticus]